VPFTHKENTMKSIRNAGAMALLAVLTVGSASAGSNRNDDLRDRIVGLWSTEGLVGPCLPDVAPTITTRNTILFHAGGTLVETARFAPGGAPGGAPNINGIPGIYQRTQGLGTWTYDRHSRRYFIHLRFDNFVDGVYHGWSTVDREIVLSQRGMLATGPVQSTRYYADGRAFPAVCGNATSTPL
jgi:hypothetical protein